MDKIIKQIENLQKKHKKKMIDLQLLELMKKEKEQALKDYSGAYRHSKGEERKNISSFTKKLRVDIKDLKENIKNTKRQLRASRFYIKNKKSKLEEDNHEDDDLPDEIQSDNI